METEYCTINLEKGIDSIGDGFQKHYFEKGYSTIIIHATKVIANEMISKYFKAEETHLEPYMEVW